MTEPKATLGMNASFRVRAPSSWPGLSGPPVAAGAEIGSLARPDKLGHQESWGDGRHDYFWASPERLSRPPRSSHVPHRSATK
jgi:hypothetical protein